MASPRKIGGAKRPLTAAADSASDSVDDEFKPAVAGKKKKQKRSTMKRQLADLLNDSTDGELDEAEVVQPVVSAQTVPSTLLVPVLDTQATDENYDEF